MSMKTARDLASQALQKAFEAGAAGGGGVPVSFYILLDGDRLPTEPNSMTGEAKIWASTERAELDAKLMWLRTRGVTGARIVAVTGLIAT